MEYDKDGFKVETIPKRRNDFCWVGVLAFIFLVVGLVVIVTLFLLPAAPLVVPDDVPTGVPKVIYSPDVSPLVYYGVENRDALEVTWSHGVNSKVMLTEALAGDVMMLEVDVTLRGYGTPAQSDVPVAAHPPLTDSDVTVEEWLEAALRADKGIKLDFKSLEAVAPTLRMLQSHIHHMKRPLWINADIAPGPNAGQQEVHIPASEFLSTVNQLFPNCTLSLGWTTGFYHDRENEDYTREMVEAMHAVTKDLRQPVTFPVRASLIGEESMKNLQWLLDQSDRYSLTLWTSTMTGDAHRLYDLVRLRKAVSPSRIYYDLPKQQREDLKEAVKTNVTGLNPLFFFPVARRDGLLLTWSGRTNSRAALQEAILSKSNIVEGDVILRGHGTERQTNEPIMARPPDSDSDVTFEEWFETIRAAEHDVVPKLDFWSADAVVPVMNILKSHISHIDFPIIISCRPLGTPGSNIEPLDPYLVYPTIYSFFPPGLSSAVSFVNVTPATGFPQQLANDAHALARDMLREPISFTLRTDVISTSLPTVKWLLGQSDSYGLTVASPEPISPVIRSEFDWGKLIYDGPRDVTDALREGAGTGGGLVNFFQSTYRIYGRDGLDIRWAHGVNDFQAYHQQAIHGHPVLMVEADVNIREDNVPVMSEHRAGNGSDVYPLEDWLRLAPYFGIMLEFHSVEALIPSLKVLQSKASDLRLPVMLKGELPGLFTKETFLDPILDMYPHVSIVIGMKPDDRADGYSRSQVEEVARMCANLTQIVVLSVDARYVRGSWDNLSWLLSQSPLYHLYIWAEPEMYQLDVTDLVFVRNNFDRSKVYYDVTPDVMEKFKMALN